MILVTVGSSHFPFDRLLRAVDLLPRSEELVVQHGPSEVRPASARCMSFAPLDSLAELVRDARVVVTHAGVGSILLALSNGKKPVVVPRLRELGEAVDDHQLECARRFSRDDLVTLVEDPAQLAAVVESLDGAALAGRRQEDVPLVRELRLYIRDAVGAAGARA